MTEGTSAGSALSPVFSEFIEHAIELASQWHDRTYRKNRWREAAFEPPEDDFLRVPVMAHLTAVALTVQRGGFDDATVAAAFLHDVIEDGNHWGEHLDYERLVDLMDKEVADLVMEVSERKYDGDGRPIPWQVRKEEYVRNLRNASARGVAISLADKLHNLWSINESLANGVDVFGDGPHRKGLQGGASKQQWFFRAVLEASRDARDERIVQIRDRLELELERFDRLTGLERSDC